MNVFSNHAPASSRPESLPGDVVLFTFDEHNAKRANAQRTQAGHASLTGNTIREGDVVPMMLVRVWHQHTPAYLHVLVSDENAAAAGVQFPVSDAGVPGAMMRERGWEIVPQNEIPANANGQAFLDGNDSLWLTSVSEAEFDGQRGHWQRRDVTYPEARDLLPGEIAYGNESPAVRGAGKTLRPIPSADVVAMFAARAEKTELQKQALGKENIAG